MCLLLSFLIGCGVGAYSARERIDTVPMLVIYVAGMVTGWLPFLLPL